MMRRYPLFSSRMRMPPKATVPRLKRRQPPPPPPPSGRGGGGDGGPGGVRGSGGGPPSGGGEAKVGRLGRPEHDIVTNFVAIRRKGPSQVRLYDVHFGEYESKIIGKEGKRSLLVRREQVPPTNLQAKFDALFGHGRWAYDGTKLLSYAGSEEVTLTQAASAVEWTHVDGEFTCPLSVNVGRGQTTLKIQFTDKTIELGSETPNQDQTNVLSAITQNASKRLFMPIGSAFFRERLLNAEDWASRKPIGRDGELMLHLGYFSSIAHAECGALMQIDRAACVMLNDIPLLDYAAGKTRRRAHNLDIRSPDVCRALNSLKKIRLKSKHKPHRTYIMFGVDDVSIKNRTFEHEGVMTNVFDFFKTQFPEIDPEKPGVTVGKARDGGVAPVVPIELLSVAPGQPSTKKSSDISQEMIATMCQETQVRFKAIEGILRTVKEAETSASAFGIEIESQLFRLSPGSARRLEPYQIMYGNGSIARVDNKGGWSLRGDRGDLRFFRPAAVKTWAVVHFGCRDLDCLAAFIKKFTEMACQRGMRGLEPQNLLKPLSGRVDLAGRERYPVLDLGAQSGDELEKHLDKLAEDGKGHLDLVLIILPEGEAVNRIWMYPALKRWAATSKHGVVTQCVQWPKLTGGGKGGGKGGSGLATSPQYAAGVLLKVNMKLGGANGILKNSLLMQMPTMVIGVDVNHGKVGSDQNSYAAVVATLDEHCTKFHTEIIMQEARQERLVQIGEVMKTLYKVWTETNPNLPLKRIFYYRDGVAHSQFDTFARPEIEDLKAAFLDLHINPELVYKVVQKRTRTRFASSRGEGRYEKVPVGLVVDREVTDKMKDPNYPNYQNYYMVPHFGLKGTPKPAHYHVLINEANLGADELQGLTFQLCHAYQRATKVVGRPAPVYWAHLAAMQAQYNHTRYRDDASDVASNHSGSTGMGAGTYLSVTDKMKGVAYWM
mmetsp:Transcript_17320/g.48244  ORF Transcript_17320/g.48244 Transcript_17320/m.48244 type:complete len:943 (-) Transcript_17320:452-3280(-)